MREDQLDQSLGALAASTMTAVAREGFIDGVWQRVGQLQERAEARTRLALFCGVFAVGLGAGLGTVQIPDFGKQATYSLIAGNDLSPSALLHVES
tara:strand:- start:17836 stop:18120 length:285 start_codon:yes stop_codon:yes gene_type:complete